MENNLLKYLTEKEFNYIKNEKNLYKKSYCLANVLFKRIEDKCGLPYMGHLIRVSCDMSTFEGKVAGLLHDVVEDIEGVTFDDLIDIGIPLNIIEALKLVTKEPNDIKLSKREKLTLYNYEIDNIIKSNNKLAIELKYSDMKDNFNLDRLKMLDKEKIHWFKLKYGENIKKLEKVRDSYDRY